MRLLYLKLFVDSETKQAFYLNLENNKTYVFKNDRRKKSKENKLYLVPMGFSINLDFILTQFSTVYSHTSLKFLFFCLVLGVFISFFSFFLFQRKQIKEVIKGKKREVTLSPAQIQFGMSRRLENNKKKLPIVLLLILIYYFILIDHFNLLVLFFLFSMLSFLGMYLFQYYHFAKVKRFFK